MKNKNPIEELHKRSAFYDDDVFDEFQEVIINDLELEIQDKESEIKDKLVEIQNAKIDIEKVKNLILSKYNSGVWFKFS